MHLVLLVRRFFCKTASCERRVFAERLPEVVAAHSRSTERLTLLMQAIAFARWLAANPGAEVISRDRSEKYASGGRRGAPEATHVADRWHLLSNWRRSGRSVETVFDRHRGRIKRVMLAAPKPAGKPAAAVLLPAKSVNRRRKYAEQRRARAPGGSPSTTPSGSGTPKGST